MPMCTFTTSVSRDDLPANFHVELAEEIGRVLNKSIEAITISVHPDTLVFRNGNSSPSAILDIWSINVFSAEKNPGYAQTLKAFIMNKLSLPEDRIATIFHDLLPEEIGRVTK